MLEAVIHHYPSSHKKSILAFKMTVFYVHSVRANFNSIIILLSIFKMF